MHLFSLLSVKYLVVIKVVGQAAYEQFVGRIWNDSGDDACTREEEVYSELSHSTLLVSHIEKAYFYLGREKLAAPRYRAEVGSREVVLSSATDPGK